MLEARSRSRAGDLERERHVDLAAQGVATLTPALKGPVNMGRNMALSFAVFLAVAFLNAYVAWHALGPAPTPARPSPRSGIRGPGSPTLAYAAMPKMNWKFVASGIGSMTMSS